VAGGVQMKYTNKTNLPDTLFKSLSNDPYYKIGDYSGSELPGPPQTLKRGCNFELNTFI